VDADIQREAAVNLAEAQAEFAARGFDYLSPGRQTFFLNRAKTDFGDFYAWPWLRKTTTGASPLTISDLKYVRSVWDANGVEYFGLDDGDDVDLTETGTPQSWWIDDTSGQSVLTAYPVGAVTFRVSYVAEAPDLVAPTDTPQIPSRYHGIWIDLAVVRAYQDSDNFAAAAALKSMVTQELQTVVERYETRNRMNSRHRLIRAGSEDD
jgi:hypothetical protein